MVQQLRLKEQFKQVLANYQVSKAGIDILAKTHFVGMLGISSSGRNTIIKKLVAGGAYTFVVSDTTRAPRVNNGVQEQNGVEYWFRSEEEVLKDLKNGLFLEAELIHDQQISGVSIRGLEYAAADNKIATTDIDPAGVTSILQIKPTTPVILTLPPSFESWIERLSGRGEMHSVEIHRRLTTALKVFEYVRSNYVGRIQCLVNDDLDQAVVDVDRIVKGELKVTADMPSIATLLGHLEAGARSYIKQI